MPPPSTHPSLHLQVLPGRYYVVKLPAGDSLPPSLISSITHSITGGSSTVGKSEGTPDNNDNRKFLSVTRTNEEISIVGDESNIPEELRTNGEATWTVIKISGPMEHGLTGILADFSAPLKAAKVPIFAISTWDTDYVLVPEGKRTEAIEALERDGWVFVRGSMTSTAVSS